MVFDRLSMERCCIAFMGGEMIAGDDGVKPVHELVSSDLGNDGGGRNGTGP